MDKDVIPMDPIEDRIYQLRGKRVMLDSDLARLYGVTTKRLNEQVARNAERFPEDFAFKPTKQELAILRSQIATSSDMPGTHGGRRYQPRVFTEHGAIMVAAVLNSPRAGTGEATPHRLRKVGREIHVGWVSPKGVTHHIAAG